MHCPSSKRPQHFPVWPPAHSQASSLLGGRAHPRREFCDVQFFHAVESLKSDIALFSLQIPHQTWLVQVNLSNMTINNYFWLEFCSTEEVDGSSSLLQLLTIFVSAKLASYVKFYQNNKDFIDSLGKYIRHVVTYLPMHTHANKTGHTKKNTLLSVWEYHCNENITRTRTTKILKEGSWERERENGGCLLTFSQSNFNFPITSKIKILCSRYRLYKSQPSACHLVLGCWILRRHFPRSWHQRGMCMYQQCAFPSRPSDQL